MNRITLVLCIAAAVGGCPRPKPPTSPHCASNTTLQLDRIHERHGKYEAGARDAGFVYWSRFYLETARFVLTGTGIDGSGAQCTAADHDSADYDRLKLGLADGEREVAWMEHERGVKFVGVVNGGPTWTWLATGQPVTQNDANTL